MEFFLYGAVVVALLVATHIVANFRLKMKAMYHITHSPIIAEHESYGEVAVMIRLLAAHEYTRLTIFVLPYALACIAVAISIPFYFQTEIPQWVAVIASSMFGWLLTYVCIKDFNPEWYIASKVMVDSVAAVIAAPAITQAEGESAQSEQRE